MPLGQVLVCTGFGPDPVQLDLMVLVLAHDFLVKLFWLYAAAKWKLPTWKRTERLPLIDTLAPSKLFDTMPCFCLHVSLPKRRQSSHAGKTGSSIPTPGFRLIRDPDASNSAIAGRHGRLQQPLRSGGVDISADGTSGGLHQLALDDSELGAFSPQAHTTNNFLKALSAKLVNIPLKSKKRRRPCISIGKSEGEVARRAELKRLMHKRIQDELLHNTKGVDTVKGDKDMALFPGHRLDSGIPVCGPRDHLEFDMAQHKNAPSATNGCIGDNYPQDRHSSFNQVRHQKSCPESVLGRALDSVCDNRTGSKNDGGCVVAKTLRSSQSCMGNLATRHLGCIPPEKTPLEHDLLRAKEPTDRHRSQAHSWDSQSAPGIWLIAQSLHSRDGSGLTLPKADMDNPEDTQMSSRCTANNADDSGTEETNFEEIPGNEGSTSEDDLREVYALAMAYAVPIDSSSSNYPSLLPSFQPSPARSKSDLPKLDLQDLQELQANHFQRQNSIPVLQHYRGGVSKGRPSLTMQRANTDHSIQHQTSHSPIVTAQDDQSSNHSETLSYLMREAELQTVQRRFKDVLSRTKPSLRVSSRFKEDFTTSSPMKSFLPKKTREILRKAGLPLSPSYNVEQLGAEILHSSGAVRPSTSTTSTGKSIEDLGEIHTNSDLIGFTEWKLDSIRGKHLLTSIALREHWPLNQPNHGRATSTGVSKLGAEDGAFQGPVSNHITQPFTSSAGSLWKSNRTQGFRGRLGESIKSSFSRLFSPTTSLRKISKDESIKVNDGVCDMEIDDSTGSLTQSTSHVTISSRIAGGYSERNSSMASSRRNKAAIDSIKYVPDTRYLVCRDPPLTVEKPRNGRKDLDRREFDMDPYLNGYFQDTCRRHSIAVSKRSSSPAAPTYWEEAVMLSYRSLSAPGGRS
ncbi:hypothetical protein S40293_06468 [Stachybotrys chartarum IBT 40293]|nr:hypothetical protein S40293_06468 [Stachybotrys chartarum IBT 40293]